MINKIVNFQKSINQFTTRKMLIPYSTSVGINKFMILGYTVEANPQKIVTFNHHTTSVLSGSNKIITFHHSVNAESDVDKTIVRKNDGD